MRGPEGGPAGDRGRGKGATVRPAEHGDLVLGGQAVIEGVMMKGKDAFAVAVRKPSGEIRIREFPIVVGAVRKRLGQTPVLRGVVTMGAMMAIGYRALRFSADEAIEETGREETDRSPGTSSTEPGHGGDLAMAAALGVALLVGVALFFWLPLVVTRLASEAVPALSGRIAFNLLDGIVRVLVFVAYVAAIGRMQEIRRIFEYHGAEHKVVHAFERKAEFTPEDVMGFSRLHPRCGTSFLLFVMVISIVVFSMIPHESSLAVKAGMRLVLLPAVAGISYEVLRMSARKAESGFFRALVAPGLLLQRMTTREPDRSQIEVAIASFRRAAGSRAQEAPVAG